MVFIVVNTVFHIIDGIAKLFKDRKSNISILIRLKENNTSAHSAAIIVPLLNQECPFHKEISDFANA
jgi:hypothetical protein